jgi:hypothetical protein
MLKKEILGKNSVCILYAFTLSMIVAVLHLIWGQSADEDELPNWFYLGFPFFIGLMTSISWKWVKLDFRITSQNPNEKSSIMSNIISLPVITGFISILGLHPFIDCIIMVGITFYVTNKLVQIQTAHSSVVRLPQTIREGILRSNYFFWKLYELDGLREFILIPNECVELKIYSNMLEEKLILDTKQIKHRYLTTYEKEFKKPLFDFNKEELVILYMAEI